MAKLIRDKYINIIDNANLSIVPDKVALQYAIDKIEEELIELKESNFEDIYEFADCIEVLYTVARLKGFSREEVTDAINTKNSEKGAFTKNIILLR